MAPTPENAPPDHPPSGHLSKPLFSCQALPTMLLPGLVAVPKYPWHSVCPGRGEQTSRVSDPLSPFATPPINRCTAFHSRFMARSPLSWHTALLNCQRTQEPAIEQQPIIISVGICAASVLRASGTVLVLYLSPLRGLPAETMIGSGKNNRIGHIAHFAGLLTGLVACCGYSIDMPAGY